MTPIDPELHRALDANRDPAELPADQQARARKLAHAVAALSEVPAVSVEQRVMRTVRREPYTSTRRVGRWITERHAITITVRPIWSLALAAVLAAVAIIPMHGPGPVLSAQEGVAQFVGRFPGAHSVDVVGSFTDWQPGAVRLRDEDHDGVWRGSVVLPVGQHEYMFVVDGERWVTDPLAGRYIADGFGRENALLIVGQAGE